MDGGLIHPAEFFLPPWKGERKVDTVPALLVALVTGWFTVLVARQYFRNHRPNLFFWSVSLAFSCLASLAYSLSLWQTPHSGAMFLIYYLLGALWMPALMGLGSLGLVFRPRTVNIVATIVCILGLIGSVLLLKSPVLAAPLQALHGGAGTGVVQQGSWLVFLIVLNSFGAIAVFLVAIMSAVKAAKKQAPARFFYGNLWLAIGILIISAAGSAARLGLPQLFWITMLIGWVLTYFGYRLLTPAAVSCLTLGTAS